MPDLRATARALHAQADAYDEYDTQSPEPWGAVAALVRRAAIVAEDAAERAVVRRVVVIQEGRAP